MELFLSFLTGMIVTVMNVFNGQLSDYVGVYLSTVLIHFIGLKKTKSIISSASAIAFLHRRNDRCINSYF